ncbi:MAG: response regulator [Armatimonadetes bacterium 55-13]|nr:response regulator [Armatimonadota bacterium]OJU62828.1 MAG: response regulator [Armatimonadetes bacterium 55-13]
MSKFALVVDDSASMRQMVSFTLKGAGFQVIEGGNGQEALDKLAQAPGGKVDLIITDLNMPVMDGITFIRNARTRPALKFTPILMLTTESGENRKAEGKAAGATGWIVKPFQPEQLLKVVQKVVA